MAERKPTAAEAMYPYHFPRKDYSAKQQQSGGSLAEAMYPRPKPNPPNPYRESLLRGLRELNARGRKP